MLSYSQAYYDLLNMLKGIYDDQEAAAIAHEVLQEITGASKLQRLAEKDRLFTQEQESVFSKMKERLGQGEPLQYVRGYEWFMGHKFRVNKAVLIPRPETEELVEWIIDDQSGRKSLSILDIGTGSGCIPISLKLALPAARVTAFDISEEAIETAKSNAAKREADIVFKKLDILSRVGWPATEDYDVIVSNPPYIAEAEKDQMDANVKDFEPAIALFVPNEDPLIFYRQIALFGREHMNTGGNLYFELHKDRANEIGALVEDLGYKDVTIRKDMHGNDRMLRAIKK